MQLLDHERVHTEHDKYATGIQAEQKWLPFSDSLRSLHLQMKSHRDGSEEAKGNQLQYQTSYNNMLSGVAFSDISISTC
jgi:hypothetical protein